MLAAMLIATHNVNGIRAAQRRGFAAWRELRRPDVIGLQEVRCPSTELPLETFGDYHVAYDPGSRAGRNGVAILTRAAPVAIRSWGGQVVAWAPGKPVAAASISDDIGLARELRRFAAEGRYLEVDLAEAPLTVASVYVPKGDSMLAPRDTDLTAVAARYQSKMAFLAGFARQLGRARRAAAARGRDYLIVGDFNIAHTRLDLRNWRGNQRSAGFLPEERDWFASIVSPRTLVDVVRRLHPHTDGPYSWWSWRGQAFANDTGWRIDYQLASPGLARRAVWAATDREADYESRISDHCPVLVNYAL